VGIRQEYLHCQISYSTSLPLKLTIAEQPHRLYLFLNRAVNTFFNLWLRQALVAARGSVAAARVRLRPWCAGRRAIQLRVGKGRRV
jgi:hypothetical protein